MGSNNISQNCLATAAGDGSALPKLPVPTTSCQSATMRNKEAIGKT
jgi:hypothetical protein